MIYPAVLAAGLKGNHLSDLVIEEQTLHAY
jgi:hypothetical protein